MKLVDSSFQKELDIQKIAYLDTNDKILNNIKDLLLKRQWYCKHYVEYKELYENDEMFNHLLILVEYCNNQILEFLKIKL